MVDKNIKWHFIGIGGIGMSGLARLLLEHQVPVSGSDRRKGALSKSLETLGAEIYEGHSADQVDPKSFVVYSSGIALDNPEREQADESRVFHRSQLLARLAGGKRSLFVAGTHGKTTTSSLLTHVLIETGCDPSFAIGGLLQPFGLNAKKGESDLFVAEADESDGTLVHYHPHSAIVTNLTNDHLPAYGSVEKLREAFQTFIHQVSNHLVWCADDPALASMTPPGASYGFSSTADHQIMDFEQKGRSISFTVDGIRLSVPLIGLHNALNATAVFLLCRRLGIDDDALSAAFASFQGVARRGEVLSEKPVTVIDDYAHHPVEIDATLAAIRQAYPHRRLLAVFQPHRPSRTEQFLEEFPKSFGHADHVVVTEIDRSSEAAPTKEMEKLLLDKFEAYCPTTFAFVKHDDLLSSLSAKARVGDVVVFLGAGSITQIAHTYAKQPAQRWKVALFCGGQTIEHDISLITARFVQESLDPAQYDLDTIGVEKEGSWSRQDDSADAFAQFLASDVSIPAFHGPLGEDGTIQGLFEFLGRPFMGCGARAAAIAMNKHVCKRLVQAEGIPTLPHVGFSEQQWRANATLYLEQIHQTLTLPVFVKAVHLGSSFGISRVANFDQLPQAIDEAFLLDSFVLVEQGIECRELEFALLGDHAEAEVFGPGEILTGGTFYHFDVKYGEQAMKTSSKPDLPPQVVQQGHEWAKKAYMAVGGEGFARVDFLLDDENRLWFSEINPFPGLTPTSLYPQLLEQAGVDPGTFFQRLLYSSWKRWNQQQKRIALQQRERG